MKKNFYFFPFTFIKVNKLTPVGDKRYELDCTIINKDSILEFGLKKDKDVFLANNVLTIK